MSLGQPGQGESIPEIARILGQDRGEKRAGVLQVVLGGEQVDAEEDERLEGLGERLLGLAQLPLHFLPVPLVPGLATRPLNQETHQIEPPLGLARRQRQQDRDRLVELARSGQGPGELDAGGFRAPIAVGGLPEGIQPLLVGTHVAVAFGQHEIELDGELGVGSQDRPGHLDLGDRLGPLLPLEQDFGFQKPDEGVAQPGVPKAGDVVAGLVLSVDLVLEDQGLRQVEGQVKEGLAWNALPQDGLGPIEVSFPGLQASQARAKARFLGSSLKPFSK